MNKLFDDLIRYKQGNMPDSEKSDFEKKIKNDKFLQDALDGLDDFLLNGNMEDLEAFFENAKKRTNELFVRKTPKKTYLLFSAAASIAIIIGLSVYFSIFKTNIESYDFKEAGLPVHMSDSQVSPLTEFTNEYKLQNYSKAELIINRLYQQNTTSDIIIYYKAIILKVNKEYQEAIEYFNKINSITSLFYEKAEYEKAICLWHIGKTNEAKQIFNNIALNPKHKLY
ncbi:MAG: hypothetical protein WCL51_17730, partial [Bacteroidota bacterium]